MEVSGEEDFVGVEGWAAEVAVGAFGGVRDLVVEDEERESAGEGDLDWEEVLDEE